MTKLVLISDTHGKHHEVKVPKGDILLHAGDCTDDAGQAALRSFLLWMEAQPHDAKLFIAGNHDWAFEKWPDQARDMVKKIAPSVTYLEDSGVTVLGLKIYGSPVSPRFCDWAFNRDRGEVIRKHWDMIPNDTDVLITHGPPMGYHDWSVYDRKHVGCKDLYEAILRVCPFVAVHGHIHHGYSTSRLTHDDGTHTTLINASVVNEAYQVVNAPWVFSI